VRAPLALAAAVVIAAAVAPPAAGEAPYEAQRRHMVDVIVRHGSGNWPVAGGTAFAEPLLVVLRTVPRHEFVPPEVRYLAYGDRPLPIGFGQTISQPYIVALMTQLLEVEPADTVLEIGTGSGYQAAVLSPLVRRVCTIEIIPALGRRAAATLQRLGYDNVETRIGDGYYGWPECGPFDAIVVTAAAGHVPPPLIAQLKPGGRLAIPVGGPFATQHLVLVEKEADGGVTTRQIIPVRFVPLVRKPG